MHGPANYAACLQRSRSCAKPPCCSLPPTILPLPLSESARALHQQAFERPAAWMAQQYRQSAVSPAHLSKQLSEAASQFHQTAENFAARAKAAVDALLVGTEHQRQWCVAQASAWLHKASGQLAALGAHCRAAAAHVSSLPASGHEALQTLWSAISQALQRGQGLLLANQPPPTELEALAQLVAQMKPLEETPPSIAEQSTQAPDAAAEAAGPVTSDAEPAQETASEEDSGREAAAAVEPEEAEDELTPSEPVPDALEAAAPDSVEQEPPLPAEATQSPDVDLAPITPAVDEDASKPAPEALVAEDAPAEAEPTSPPADEALTTPTGSTVAPAAVADPASEPTPTHAPAVAQGTASSVASSLFRQSAAAAAALASAVVGAIKAIMAAVTWLLRAIVATASALGAAVFLLRSFSGQVVPGLDLRRGHRERLESAALSPRQRRRAAAAAAPVAWTPWRAGILSAADAAGGAEGAPDPSATAAYNSPAPAPRRRRLAFAAPDHTTPLESTPWEADADEVVSPMAMTLTPPDSAAAAVGRAVFNLATSAAASTGARARRVSSRIAAATPGLTGVRTRSQAKAAAAVTSHTPHPMRLDDAQDTPPPSPEAALTEEHNYYWLRPNKMVERTLVTTTPAADAAYYKPLRDRTLLVMNSAMSHSREVAALMSDNLINVNNSSGSQSSSGAAAARRHSLDGNPSRLQ